MTEMAGPAHPKGPGRTVATDSVWRRTVESDLESEQHRRHSTEHLLSFITECHIVFNQILS